MSRWREKRKYLAWAPGLMQEIFESLLVTFLLLLLVEAIFQGSVSNYLNLNGLLIVVIAVGALAALTAAERAEKRGEKRLTRGDIITALCAGMAGAVIVWHGTRDIGWLSYLLPAIVGALIAALLPLLIVRGDG